MYNPMAIIGVIGAIIGAGLAKNYFGDEGYSWTTILGAAIGGGVFGGASQLFIEIINKIKKQKVNNSEIHNEVALAKDEVSVSSTTTIDMEEPIEMVDIETRKETNKPFYYGFGGWLYLVSIGQLYTLYIALTTIFETDIPMMKSPEWSMLTEPQYESYSALWKPYLYIEIIGCSIYILLLALIAFLTIKLSKYYKRAQVSFYVYNVFYSLISMSFMLAINSNYEDSIYLESDFTKIISQTTVTSIIWIPYFLFSKRVRNTFNR